MKQKSQNFLLSSLAALAAAVSPSRAGTSAPGNTGTLAGAPSPLSPGARSSPHLRLRGSLRACTLEGLFAELISAFAGGALFTGWAIHLGASAFYTGVLVALPQIAQLFHVPGAWTTTWLGHRRACLWLVGLSRQVGLVLVVLPFLPVSDATRRAVLLAVAGLAAILGVLGNNAWVAWMGELVPGRVRGRYFGKRTGLCMFGGALAAAISGVLVDEARVHDVVGPTLAALQLVACLCGILTILLMRKQHDPAPVAPPRRIALRDAIEPLRDRRVRTLFAYHLTWNAAVGVAGSFFALHMVRDLKMGFALLALHGALMAVVRLMVAPLWGVLIDRLGARPVLAACSFSIAAIPFLWLFATPERLWPLALDAVMAGVFWSGHALASFALPLAVTGRRERPFYVAAFAAASGLAFAAATATGGALATMMPPTIALAGVAVHNLQVLFVISGVLRLGAAFLCLRIHEPAARGVNSLFTAILAPLVRPAVAPAAVLVKPVERPPRDTHASP